MSPREFSGKLPPPRGSWRTTELVNFETLTAGLVALALPGCGKILGVDEFAVDHGGGSNVLEAGSSDPLPPFCSTTGASDGGDECVGVRGCATGTVADRKGGCTAVLPSTPCDTSTCPQGAPCEGSPELLGQPQCSGTGSIWLTCASSGDYVSIPLGADPGSVRYVNQAYTGQSDGTKAQPYRTISEALANVPPGGVVLIAAGTYAEDLVVDQAGVQLVGACPDQVLVRGTGATAEASYPCAFSGPVAAICVAASAAGASIRNLEITGAADGIAIVGATSVRVEAVEVVDTERYGIRVEELGRADGTHSAASATLNSVSVRGARGSGVYVAGATVDDQSFLNVSGTRLLNDYAGYGVSVLSGGVGYLASAGTPGSVSLSAAVMVGNAGPALHVSGSTATVTDSYLGNLDGFDPLERGILVERDTTASQRHGQLVLSRTIVQHTRDAAIDVRSSDITLEDVTIRNTLGRSGDGCSGQGIRLRDDRLAPATAMLRHSLVEGSGQAAIHSLGGAATVDRSILRGSGPGDAAPVCAPHLGDGVTLESLPAPGSPSVLTLDHALVEGNARAAVASFGGKVTATSSVLSCNAYGLVAVDDPPGERTDLRCGCNGALTPCRTENRALEPWISPGAGSGHSTTGTQTWTTPVQVAFTFQQLTNGIAWLPDAPDVAPAFPHAADADAGPLGCATLSGVPNDLDPMRRRIEIWAEGYVPSTWQVVPGVFTSDCTSPIGAGTAAQASLFVSGQPVDTNRGLLFVGASSVAQSPESGAGWTLLAGNSVRYNVDVGWVTVTRTDGLFCLGSPWSGVPVPGEPSSARVLAEPGVVANVGWLGNCWVDPCPGGYSDPDPAHSGQCLSGSAAESACSTALSALEAGGAGSSAACSACRCKSSLPQVWLCLADPNCTSLLRCAIRTACRGTACESACSAEYAAVTTASGTPAFSPGIVGISDAPGCAAACGFKGDGG